MIAMGGGEGRVPLWDNSRRSGLTYKPEQNRCFWMRPSKLNRYCITGIKLTLVIVMNLSKTQNNLLYGNN